MISFYKNKNQKGFSFGEIMTVLAIIAMISSVAIFAFRNMNENQVLDKSVLSILSIVNEARSSSLSSKDSSDHGVYVEENRLVSFIGSSYNQSDPRNVIYDLNSMVKISSVVPVSIVFKRTSGKLSEDSQINLNISLKNNTNASSSLVIFATGIIQRNAH